MREQGGIAGRVGAWLRRLLGRASPDHNQTVGRRGEKLAERYLRRRGYRIVARNFRAAGAEIDLVAMDGDTVVFVEVKTRRAVGAGAPEDSVTEHKQRQLRRAAEIFSARYRAHDRPMRFDVIAIAGEGRAARVELLRDAF